MVRRRMLVALLGAALVATACGGTGPATPTNLRVLMTDDWVTPPFLDAVRRFELSHPDVRVVIDKGPIRLMPEAVRAGISSGAPPDVVQGHAFSAAAVGLAQPLDDLWRSRLEVAEFFPGAIEDVTWDGRRYGVPLDTNAMVLMYNSDRFRAAGLPDPGPAMTFSEFEALARALTTPDGSQRGIAMPTSSWWTYGWIRANGGEVVQVGSDGRAEIIDGLGQEVDAVIEQLREVTHDLYPSILLDRGLAAALRSYVGRLPISGLLVTQPEEFPRLAPEVESGAYFLVCEAVTNALKHAGASGLEIGLRLADGWLEVVVADDGRGFDVSAGPRRGGLLHMDDRVRSFGGSLEITSAAGSGTRVVATFPERAPAEVAGA